MDDAILKHYGVLGMKWGVRRYQNPDGTLTAAGRRRAERASAKEAKRAADAERKEHEKRTYTPKTVKAMKKTSDEDLQAAIKRLELEKRYRDLMRAEAPPKAQKEKGESYALELIKQTRDKIAPQITAHYAAKLINKLIGETERVKINPDEDDDDKYKEVIKEVVFANNKKK